MKRVSLAIVLSAVLTLGAAAAAPAIAAAAPFAVQRGAVYELPTMNQAENDAFGAAVDVEGDVMAIGAPSDAGGTGAAFAVRRVGGVWQDPVRIVPPDLTANDRFGQSVSVDGDRIAIGSPFHDTASPDVGAVYIYQWSGTAWVLETAHLVGYTANDRFGSDVAIDNGYLAIGAPLDDDRAFNAGSVTVYRLVAGNWLLDGVMTDTIGSAEDNLGSSVDIDATGDLIVVAGAPYADKDAFWNCGAISMFDRDEGSWTHHDTQWAPVASRQATAWFGSDVAISDRRIIVGAPMRSIGGLLAGEAYTYTMPMSLWQHEQTLTNPSSTGDDQFGIGVACEGNTFLVGAFFEDGYVGAVYPYTSWYGSTTAWPKLSATGPSVTQFGTSVALSQGTIVGGAQMASSPDTVRCGGVYYFTSRGTVTGTVRDADDGVLLPGKEVYALPVGAAEGDWQVAASAVVDGTGHYTLSADAGTYIIQVQDPDAQYHQGYHTTAMTYSLGTPVTVNANGTVSGIDIGMFRIGAVYRFYNAKSGTHFYTASVAERESVRANLSHIYAYEGMAYVTSPTTDIHPLYRFYNQHSGSHFYTADVTERDYVLANLGYLFSYDGPAYGVSLALTAGTRPVYRFYNVLNGSHFYTASEVERQNVQDTLGAIYQFEGPAFYIDN